MLQSIQPYENSESLMNLKTVQVSQACQRFEATQLTYPQRMKVAKHQILLRGQSPWLINRWALLALSRRVTASSFVLDKGPQSVCRACPYMRKSRVSGSGIRATRQSQHVSAKSPLKTQSVHKDSI